MDVGIALPQFDFSIPGEQPLRWDTLVGWARKAEDLGFTSLWLADHLFLSLDRYGGEPGRYDGYDPLVVLGGLARATARARLGTLVVCTQLRPPAVLAKALATADVLSGGRVVVGLGAGWNEAEYQVAGVPFEPPGVRLAQLEEAVSLLRAMFSGGPATFTGRHYRVVDARCLPRPVQDPHPPLWIGGSGDRLLEVVARVADGWNTAWTWTPDAYRERVSTLDAACERAGRDPASVTRSLGLYALVGEDAADLHRRFARMAERSPGGVLDGVDLERWRVGRLVGTVAEVREQVAGWADAGVSTLIVGAGAASFALTNTDDVELLAAACTL